MAKVIEGVLTYTFQNAHAQITIQQRTNPEHTTISAEGPRLEYSEYFLKAAPQAYFAQQIPQHRAYIEAMDGNLKAGERIAESRLKDADMYRRFATDYPRLVRAGNILGKLFTPFAWITGHANLEEMTYEMIVGKAEEERDNCMTMLNYVSEGNAMLNDMHDYAVKRDVGAQSSVLLRLSDKILDQHMRYVRIAENILDAEEDFHEAMFYPVSEWGVDEV